MRSWRTAAAVTLAAAASAQGQALDLIVETGPSLADGILAPGETASFTVRAFGTAPPGEPYRALASLLGFEFGELGACEFTQTGYNPYLAQQPGTPGLLYDEQTGRIGMSPTGGFIQPPGPVLADTSNPIFLFSFDWTPSAFDQRTIAWTAAASNGSIYAGNDPFNWTVYPVMNPTPASGSFFIAPAPGALAPLAVAITLAARRRRRTP